MGDADEIARRLVIRHAREDAMDEHLRTCPDLTAQDATAYDGTYGCDTGCEYARLEAELSCPHGHAERFCYGEFGDLADMIAEMGREA